MSHRQTPLRIAWSARFSGHLVCPKMYVGDISIKSAHHIRAIYQILYYMESMKVDPQDQIPPTFRVGGLHGVELFEITIDKLQRYFAQGRLSSVDYVRFCLERIQCVRASCILFSSCFKAWVPLDILQYLLNARSILS